jgi:hypothetical protein
MASEEFIEYYMNLQEKIKEKDLSNFWLVCGNDSFRPYKGYTMQSFKQYLKEKAQYYRGKRVANVTINFQSLTYVKQAKDKNIFNIEIVIYNVDEDGTIGKSYNDTWSLLLSYNSYELMNNKFTLTEMATIIENTANKKIIRAAAGPISYSDYIIKLNKKKANRARI